MKKGSRIVIILLILSVVTGVFALVTSNEASALLYLLFSEKQQQQQEKSPIFEYETMTIELTTDFEEAINTLNYDFRLISDDYEVLIDKVVITSDAPEGGFALSHLAEFMEYYIYVFLENRPESVVFYEIDGILYYDADDDLDGELDRLFAMYHYKNTFWTVQFRPRTSTFDEAKEQMMAWSKNVTFPEE